MVLAEAGRSLKNLPKDLAAAIEAGRVLGAVVSRFLELEKSPVLRWLMQFGAVGEISELLYSKLVKITRSQV
nr:protein reticulata-related 4, chloroplastic [Quercus suber]